MIKEVEDLKKQLHDIIHVVNPEVKKSLIGASKELSDILTKFESKLIQLKDTGKDQDMVRWPVQLSEKIFYLASTVTSADFPPADPHVEIHEILQEKITKYQDELEEIKNSNVLQFINMAKEHGLDLMSSN